MKANESVGIFSAAQLGSWQGIPASPHLALNSTKTFSSQSVTHPKATPNPLVETEGSPEEALFHLFLVGEVKPAFGGWDLQHCCCWLWVRAGRQRWKGELRRECWWIPSEIPCCISLSAAQENQAGCGGSESAPLHVFESWHWRFLHNPDPHSLCQLCSTPDSGSCSCLLCWIWDQAKCIYGCGRHEML